ncbi:MAG: hypothetical protein IPK14_08845 [Blastocatellia bacterium]|nr:hypothetical protein [Blastocatellia bacterium]
MLAGGIYDKYYTRCNNSRYLKALKMPAIARDYTAVARCAKRDGQWQYEEFLKELWKKR